jgi:predicted permease
MPDFRQYVRGRLPALHTRPEREIEIVDEIALQLEAAYSAARSRGASEAEAMAAASREVTDWHALAADLRRVERPHAAGALPGAGTGGLMTGFAGDVRYAVRGLFRTPGLSAIVVVTLSLALGVGAAAYAVVDAVLLRPLPFADPDRLTLLHATVPPEGRETTEITFPDAQDLAGSVSGLEGMALLQPYAGITTSLDPPERLEGFAVSTNLLPLLGVQPVLGRTFVESDAESGRSEVVLLGHGFWQRLGGRADIVGETIEIDEVPRTVVGVLPAAFRLEVLPGPGDVYLPLTAESPGRQSRAFRAYRAIVRLSEGVAIQQVNLAAASVGEALAREYPDTNAGRTFVLRPLAEAVTSEARGSVWMVAVLVGLILIIAAVNTGHLLLARAVAGARETAVRLALGADAWRTARYGLVEASVLAGVGVAGAVLVARWILVAIRTVPGVPLPRLAETGVDARVMLALVAVGAAMTMALGVIPLVVTRRAGLVTLTGGHETAGPRTRRLRALLVVAQTGLAFVLLAASALLTVSLQRLLAVPAGFDAGVATMRVTAPAARYPDRAATTRLFRDLLDALREQPGVRQAGFVSILPLAGNAGSSLTIQGREDTPIASRPEIGWHWASPGYLETMGIRLVRGRWFTWDDLARDAHVTLVTETLARLHFPGEDPIGRRVYYGPIPATGVPEWHEIVGVVSDVRHRGLEREPDARAYDLFGQHWGRTVSIAVRSAEGPAVVAAQLRRLLRERDPRLATFAVRTTDDLISAAVQGRRLLLWLVSGLALAGLSVAVLGVYGLMANTVTERRREIAVRVAVGASASRIGAMVVGQGVRLVGLGLALGAAVAYALRGGIESQLFGLSSTDVPTLVGTAALLIVAGLLPCLVLARRAAHVDPARTLRE